MKKADSPDTERLQKRIRQDLDDFVFFHLGSDAQVAVTEGPAGIEIVVEHPRVHRFTAKVDTQQLRQIAEHPDHLETILLEYLSKNRRHS